jgi:DNA mismatch repair ATPase MutL
MAPGFSTMSCSKESLPSPALSGHSYPNLVAGLLWSFNSASAQEKVQQSAPPTLAAPSSAAAATPQPQQQQQQVVPPSDLPGSSRAPDIPLQPASTAQPSDRQVPTTIIEQSSSSGTPSAAPHSESTPQSPAALQPPRATSEKYGSAVEFTLEEKAKKEDEEGKRQARKRKKGRLRELEEVGCMGNGYLFHSFAHPYQLQPYQLQQVCAAACRQHLPSSNGALASN